MTSSRQNLAAVIPTANFPSPTKINKLIAKPLPNKIVRYDAGDGPNSHVTLQWSTGIPAKDATTRTISALTQPMCLTKEEVRGQKVESEMILPQGSSALQIVPGGVFNAQILLNSGQFSYLKWDKRKSYAINVTSNLAKKTSATIMAAPGGGISESAAQSVVRSLTKADNIAGMPNGFSTSEMKKSTFQESMGLSIGASFFYMGISGANQFAFSSEKYRFMYVYTFDQAFLAVSADAPSSPADAYTDLKGITEDALFIREVKYGRRLYVIMESEYELEKYSNEFNGNLNWGFVSAKLNEKSNASKAGEYINIRVQAQGGQALAVTDYTKLPEALDGYFKSSYAQNDIVPLSYKVTDLSGKPVSLVAKAFLDGNHCLKSKKVRIRLKDIAVIRADDGQSDRSEQIYGNLIVRLFNESGKQVLADGTVMPAGASIVPSGSISIAREAAPLRLAQIRSERDRKRFGENDQSKSLDVNITSLDMVFQVDPIVKEQDDFGDDTFITDTKLRKTMRRMLIEGSTSTTFEFRHDASLLELTVEILPL
jgi:hypothetical protein